jgi:hypothetical protein
LLLSLPLSFGCFQQQHNMMIRRHLAVIWWELKIFGFSYNWYTNSIKLSMDAAVGVLHGAALRGCQGHRERLSVLAVLHAPIFWQDLLG